jgi:hypothetical protein
VEFLAVLGIIPPAFEFRIGGWQGGVACLFLMGHDKLLSGPKEGMTA